jgi:putative Mn2+ efflux pump MntP
MSNFELLVLSIGLAMDAVAISFLCSICNLRSKKRLVIKAAFFFGLFQALMPIIGFLAGVTIKDLLQGSDHWIAFILLSMVGGKMIIDHEDNEECSSLYSNKQLLILALATSIDALIVGVTFTFIQIDLTKSVLIIGLVTFILSVLAGFLGRKVASLNSKYFKIAGGLAIIGIGLKILISHLF